MLCIHIQFFNINGKFRPPREKCHNVLISSLLSWIILGINCSLTMFFIIIIFNQLTIIFSLACDQASCLFTNNCIEYSVGRHLTIYTTYTSLIIKCFKRERVNDWFVKWVEFMLLIFLNIVIPFLWFIVAQMRNVPFNLACNKRRV